MNVDDYRHIGHKPKTREMAILMMADALEGASRAVFSEEDPSPQKITALVERIVGEKLCDGQLSESDLTLGELTIVKTAFAEALLGHYHQRIPYPNFPQGDALSEGQTGRSSPPDRRLANWTVRSSTCLRSNPSLGRPPRQRVRRHPDAASKGALRFEHLPGGRAG